MDWKTFFSNIISSAIWPIVVVIIVLLLREQINQLILSMKNLRYKELEVNFGDQASKINKYLEEANIPDSSEIINKSIRENNSELIEKINKIKDENSVSPRSAIIEAWLIVEDRLRNLADTYMIRPNKTTLKITKELYDMNVISKELFEACDGLREYRNKAAHSINFEGHPAQSNDYINLTMRVASALTDKMKR